MERRGKGGILVRNEAHARELMAAWEASGRPLSAWCLENGLAGYSFRYWKERLRATMPTLPQLVEVRVAEPILEPIAYDIVLGNGRVVRVGARFDDLAVARLVTVLERAC